MSAFEAALRPWEGGVRRRGSFEDHGDDCEAGANAEDDSRPEDEVFVGRSFGHEPYEAISLSHQDGYSCQADADAREYLVERHLCSPLRQGVSELQIL